MSRLGICVSVKKPAHIVVFEIYIPNETLFCCIPHNIKKIDRMRIYSSLSCAYTCTHTHI